VFPPRSHLYICDSRDIPSAVETADDRLARICFYITTVTHSLRDYTPFDLFPEWPSSMYFDFNLGKSLALILFNDILCRKPERLIMIMNTESEHITILSKNMYVHNGKKRQPHRR